MTYFLRAPTSVPKALVVAGSPAPARRHLISARLANLPAGRACPTAPESDPGGRCGVEPAPELPDRPPGTGRQRSGDGRKEKGSGRPHARGGCRRPAGQHGWRHQDVGPAGRRWSVSGHPIGGGPSRSVVRITWSVSGDGPDGQPVSWWPPGARAWSRRRTRSWLQLTARRQTFCSKEGKKPALARVTRGPNRAAGSCRRGQVW